MNTAIKSADDRTAILWGDWRSRVRIAYNCVEVAVTMLGIESLTGALRGAVKRERVDYTQLAPLPYSQPVISLLAAAHLLSLTSL